MNAELAHVAVDAAHFPAEGWPELAVAGRSNVGKSSFINALVGRKRLARTSGAPGKTRAIHFYALERSAYLVDLPGYGYATVSREERRAWGPLVESYLRGARPALRGVLLLVDVRRGPADEELELLEWLTAEGLGTRVVLTKADKLRRSELTRQRQRIAARLPVAPDAIACTSARTGRELATVGAWVREWIGVELRRPDGSPLL